MMTDEERRRYFAGLQKLQEQQDELRRRLCWCHGPERAAAIMAGTDEAAKRDLWLWARLGGS